MKTLAHRLFPRDNARHAMLSLWAVIATALGFASTIIAIVLRSMGM